MIFLIDYDRSRGELVSIKSFGDSDLALAREERLAKELELHRSGVRRDIVLLEARSEDPLRKTHGRYFSDLAGLAREGIAVLTP